ncbi:hypothetical protein KI387_009455, partial [Taxus chinensis]
TSMEEDREEKQGSECCQKWKDKLRKAESGRQKLREAINILEKAVRNGQEEICTLKKEFENEQKRAEDGSRRVREEERQRVELEKEHDSLKSEFASVSKRLNDFESKQKLEEDREVEHAKTMKFNVDEEKKLRELLEKERQALQFEKKRSEEMKKQANAEKTKAEEERKCADRARKKAEEERICVGIERKNFEEEKKRADAERKRAENEMATREMLEKKLQQLELEKQSAEKGRRYHEAKENAPALVENTDKKSKKEKILKEQLKKERQQLKAERKRVEEQKKQIELLEKECSVLKEQLEEEKQRFKVEMKRAEEDKNRRQTIERECSVLKEQLMSASVRNSDGKKLNGKKILEELLQKEKQELKLEGKKAKEQKKQVESLEKAYFLLKEQFEKAEMKRAEEEKRQREALESKCSVLKEELASVIQCLKSHDGQLKDTRRELQQLQMKVYPVDGSSICKRTLPKSKMLVKSRALKPNRSACLLIEDEIQRNSGLNRSNMLKTFPVAGLSVSGGNFTETIPGINSVMEPSIGGSVEKPVQSSALHSTVASFSDRKLVESQGRVARITSNSSKLRKHKKKRELVVTRESPGITEKVCTRVLALPESPMLDKDTMDSNDYRSFISKQGNALSELPKLTAETANHSEINGALEEKKCSGRKRKSEPENITDSIMDLFHKEKKMHLMIEEKLESLREALRVQQDTSVDVPSLTQMGIKPTRKRKRDNAANSLYKEDTDSGDHKIDEYKAYDNVKEVCSANSSKLNMLNQENELQEDESNDKVHIGIKEMPNLIGCSHGQAGKTRDEGHSHLVEIAPNKQVNIMGIECTVDFDFKGLLQLDNESEEELYILAKESPLSPTLPEIPFPCLEELEDDKFDPLLEQTPFNLNKLLTTRDSCMNALENKNNVPSQGFGARKTLELQKGFDEESYFQAKQNSSSFSELEKPFDVIEQLDGHCTDLFCEEAPQQFITMFTSVDCGTKEFKTNKTITNKKLQENCGVLDNNLSFDVIRKDDTLGNIDDNKPYELCGEEIDDHYVKSKLSQYQARDAGSNEGSRVKGSEDLSSRKCAKSSDTVDLKSLQPSFNTQIEMSSMENFEEHYIESDGRNVNEVIGCNIEQIKELRADEDGRHQTFTEIVPKNVVVTQNRENHSPELVEDDENAGICNGCYVGNFPIRSSYIFSAGGVGSDTIQPGDDELTESKGHFGSSLIQGNFLYVDHGKSEQTNDIGVTCEDKKQKCYLKSCQEQIKPTKICEDEEQRCFPVFWILSSSYEDENASYNLFKSIDSYLGVIFDASSGVPDLERLALSFDSAAKFTREETVSICISTLVSNLASLVANSGARRLCDPDHASFLWSKSLMDQINKVTSNNVTKGSFAKVFVLDVLVSLMTKFLTEGKVMVYTASADGKHGVSNFNGSPLEGEHRKFSVLRRIATIAEIEAGSHVLASFCLALDNMDCLYEVMYKVLRWCKKDSIWLLTVVHSITFLCWKHSLQVSKSNLLGNTICTIILLLEGHEKGVPRSLLNYFDATTVQIQAHPLSMHCPFAEDALSMDANISSLLETLNHISVSTYKCEETPIKALGCKNSVFIDNVERKVESQKRSYCQQDGHAALNNLQDVSKHGDHFRNQKSDLPCHLSVLNDTVHALELVAQYLGWDWTYNELIPQFWRMAQPNAPELLIMVIFLLVGTIGRFGIDFDEFEQSGVEELRKNLSTLLDVHSVTKDRHTFSFLCQLAAAQSLFELMLGNMKMSTSNKIGPPQGIVGRKAGRSTHLKILKKWYSNLSAVQQSLVPEYMKADISPLTS